MNKINIYEVGFMKNYFVIKLIGIISLLLGFLSGFYFKTISGYYLILALRLDAKWKRDDYFASLYSEEGFFSLEKHDYSWSAFILITFLVFIFLLVLRIRITNEQIKIWFSSIENPKNEIKASKKRTTMNDAQRKILITKILPKIVLLVIIIIGILSYIFIPLWLKNQNEKFYNDPVNQEKIKRLNR